jgi:hypothetical protein
MHGTRVYFLRVSPKGPAFERFPDIKKKKHNYRISLMFDIIITCCMISCVLHCILGTKQQDSVAAKEFATLQSPGKVAVGSLPKRCFETSDHRINTF